MNRARDFQGDLVGARLQEFDGLVQALAPQTHIVDG